MNRTRTIKEVRGRWADSRRAVFLLEQEIERTYRKDPVGAEFLRNLVALPFKKLLDILDEPMTVGEDLDFALSLAGLNNFNQETFERKFDVLIPYYRQIMHEKDYEVTFEVKRRVVAKLVPQEGIPV